MDGDELALKLLYDQVKWNICCCKMLELYLKIWNYIFEY